MLTVWLVLLGRWLSGTNIEEPLGHEDVSEVREPGFPDLCNILGFVRLQYIPPEEALRLGPWYPAQRGEPGPDKQFPNTPGGANEDAGHEDLRPSDQAGHLDHVGGGVQGRGRNAS